MKLRNAEAITIHIYMQSGHCSVSYCSYTYTLTTKWQLLQLCSDYSKIAISRPHLPSFVNASSVSVWSLWVVLSEFTGFGLSAAMTTSCFWAISPTTMWRLISDVPLAIEKVPSPLIPLPEMLKFPSAKLMAAKTIQRKDIGNFTDFVLQVLNTAYMSSLNQCSAYSTNGGLMRTYSSAATEIEAWVN